ncbi:MAG: hypothetical protein A2X34_06825 [Elusimicrobia bacterium GWC2_51_8]|nr:MAG: hypothetical protein A2X34_06825 [Elusimicrobia bacterium GWC2_51_8]HCE97220.1 hypothetical protein [Elusimicrobiota bacterium]
MSNIFYKNTGAGISGPMGHWAPTDSSPEPEQKGLRTVKDGNSPLKMAYLAVFPAFLSVYIWICL